MYPTFDTRPYLAGRGTLVGIYRDSFNSLGQEFNLILKMLQERFARFPHQCHDFNGSINACLLIRLKPVIFLLEQTYSLERLDLVIYHINIYIIIKNTNSHFIYILNDLLQIEKLN
jgi:hypothetical protein